MKPKLNEAQLCSELEQLCTRIGYRKGGSPSLHQVPGLIRLAIAGGPAMPDGPNDWRERRDALRDLLTEIAVTEVKEQLGEQYKTAAEKVFRLDAPQPLTQSKHEQQPLTKIQEELTEEFGEARTSGGFRKNHRPVLFALIADALIEREAAEQPQKGGSDEEPKPDSPTELPSPPGKGNEEPPPSPERADKRLTLAVGGAVAVAFTVLAGLVVGSSILGSSEAAPLKKQIADDAPSDAGIRVFRKVHLRDAATPSYLVVVRRPPPRPNPEAQSWDEVRIYDANGSDAELRFAVQPVALIGGAPTVMALGAVAGNTTGRMYRFQFLGIHDTNADGRAEIFGGFRDQISSVIRPVAIGWDATTDRYELLPLIPDQPAAPVWGEGRPGLGAASWAQRESRAALKVYVRPDDRHPALYGATEVAVQRASGLGWLFIGGYATTSGAESVSREGSGVRADRRGLKFNHQFAFGRDPAINRLTVEAARLRDSNGLTRPRPCRIYATARIGPGLTVPKLVVSASGKEPLAPRKLNLAKHVLC